jgi:hypothetical protein
VVAELDVSGSGMGADAALALVSAGRALQTLRLGEWAVPVGELRSGGRIGVLQSTRRVFVKSSIINGKRPGTVKV